MARSDIENIPPSPLSTQQAAIPASSFTSPRPLQPVLLSGALDATPLPARSAPEQDWSECRTPSPTGTPSSVLPPLRRKGQQQLWAEAKQLSVVRDARCLNPLNTSYEELGSAHSPHTHPPRGVYGPLLNGSLAGGCAERCELPAASFAFSMRRSLRRAELKRRSCRRCLFPAHAPCAAVTGSQLLDALSMPTLPGL